MSTSAQIAANQQNAQRSSGPKTDSGKAISALNNFRYGFTGAFCILPWEDQEEYDQLSGGLLDDHRPSNTTEHLLVKTMTQSCWLRQRALTLQQLCFNREMAICDGDCEKQLALYLRYQTTHDRAFTKALDQLQKPRAEKRKEEIGFESQEKKAERATSCRHPPPSSGRTPRSPRKTPRRRRTSRAGAPPSPCLAHRSPSTAPRNRNRHRERSENAPRGAADSRECRLARNEQSRRTVVPVAECRRGPSENLGGLLELVNSKP